MSTEYLAERLRAGDPSLFVGTTASHSLGWLTHPERYLGPWLDRVLERLPQNHSRSLLLGMGGSSSPARLYAESRRHSELTVLDTSNPDTIASIDFADATVIASSKSGGTIETQTLLAHALAHGLEPANLVIITDPRTSLGELGRSLGALVIEGDPNTGGRFSSLSPFGLVPALYAGWSVEELRDELSTSFVTLERVQCAIDEAHDHASLIDDGRAFFDLGADPITSGGALWLEQLVAETTGKDDRGFIPVLEGPGTAYRPRDMQHYHMLASLLAWHLGVDPFNQPNVESAKKNVFALLAGDVPWNAPDVDVAALRASLQKASYRVVQAFAPLETSTELAGLRAALERSYGVTTANLGPRYLHSTGQLHKGGPLGIVAVQVVQRPRSAPRRIQGRHYSFHDLHMAQALSDYRAMTNAGRTVYQLIVDDMGEAESVLLGAS